MKAWLAIGLIAASAGAQTTNTSCFVNGQWVTCSSQQPFTVDTRPTDFLSAMGGVENLPGAPAARQQVTPAADPRSAAWSHLADLIKEHRCADAIDFAIRQGGTEAGLRTKALCQ